MYCEKCGKERIDDARFCEQCGTQFLPEEITDPGEQGLDAEKKPTLRDLPAEGAEPDSEHAENETADCSSHQEKSIIDKVDSSQEGVEEMQWIYEYSFWKNPTILITTAKVMLLGLLAPTLLMFLLTLEEGLGEALQVTGTILSYGLLLLAGLLALGYVLVGVIYGKYIVLFKMNSQGIDHIQLQKQVKRAQALGLLTALAGMASGNLSAAGAGLLAASRHNLHTRFNKIKSIKAVRSRNTIYLNEALTKNQIYPEQGEFDQVLDFIIKHAPKNVRISGR